MKKHNGTFSRIILIVLITIVTLMAGNGEVVGDGNGEVTLTNNCFTSIKDLDRCLKQLYPKIDTNNIAFSQIKEALKRATDRGTNGSIETGNINLANKERLVIYAKDISEAKKPLSINIPNAKMTQTQERLIIDINTNDIKDKVIVKNSEQEVLIKYTITK